MNATPDPSPPPADAGSAVRETAAPAGTGADAGKRPRVAVIAVHGVADQQPGATARTLADLLLAAAPGHGGQPRYRLEGSDDIGLHVAPLPPSAAAQREWPQVAGGAAAPTRRLAKALRQSIGSDLHRRAPPRRPPVTAANTAPAGSAAAPATPPDLPHLADPDVELSDFLLAQAVRNHTPTAAYDTCRLRLLRRGSAAAGAEAGEEDLVDIHELYWADLSRLGGALPRIVTELFTLIFRLSQLGRDTVAAAARQFRDGGDPDHRWRALDVVQATLDWIFSRVLAQLMLQLLVAVLIVAPLALVQARAGLDWKVARVLLVLLPAALLMWLLYRWRWTAPRLLAIAAGSAAFVALLWVERQALHGAAAWIVGLCWLALLVLLTDWLLAVCNARFPLTQLCGRVIGLLSLAVVLWSAAHSWASDLTVFVEGGLRAIECLLMAVLLSWIVQGLLLLAWVPLGHLCARSHGWTGRATVGTARLGLFSSMAFFLTLVMAGWALIEPQIERSVGELRYQPWIFTLKVCAVPPCAEASAAVDGSVVARAFLADRFQNSTASFSLVVLLVFLVVGYLVLGLLPAVLAELELLGEKSLPLGRWLTRTFRGLEGVLGLLVTLSTVLAVFVAIGFGYARLHLVPPTWLGSWLDSGSASSQRFLAPLTLVLAAASATTAITVLGGLLSRYLPGLRGPLDIALDVDNHFREFPRRAIPRARIFARYAALLRHLVDQGYERIVVVAHSQGTVLSAEMLRYLTARAAEPHGQGVAALLGRALLGRVHLLTAGCPLRQLYASRFPVLYPWVLRPQHDDGHALQGPTVGGIGVLRWINAYTTGDYVGRWLWTRPARPGHDLAETLVDEYRKPCDVYETTERTAALLHRAATHSPFDVCLGAGAHTHYFEPQQQLMAGLVDALIASPWPPVVPAPPAAAAD